MGKGGWLRQPPFAMIAGMPRTRDYTLILGTIGVLIVAITAVIALGLSSRFSQRAAVFASLTENGVAHAEIILGDTPSYAERIAALKEKISAVKDDVFAATLPPDEATASGVPAATPGDVQKEKRCGNYHNGGAGWSAAGIQITEIEGARIVYRDIVTDVSTSTSSPTPARNVVLQLPVHSLPSGAQNCIATDVIGVAVDGSLIRNSEVSAYRVFGAGTLIGYALDGFPIYGTSSGATDVCGGKISAGQYHYELSTARDTLINCYASSPVAI